MLASPATTPLVRPPNVLLARLATTLALPLVLALLRLLVNMSVLLQALLRPTFLQDITIPTLRKSIR